LLLADAALTTFFGAVLAISTILTCLARIVTGAGCSGENVEWNLIDEKYKQYDLSENPEEPWLKQVLCPPS